MHPESGTAASELKECLFVPSPESEQTLLQSIAAVNNISVAEARKQFTKASAITSSLTLDLTLVQLI